MCEGVWKPDTKKDDSRVSSKRPNPRLISGTKMVKRGRKKYILF